MRVTSKIWPAMLGLLMLTLLVAAACADDDEEAAAPGALARGCATSHKLGAEEGVVGEVGGETRCQ